jgi:hypothetical protein
MPNLETIVVCKKIEIWYYSGFFIGSAYLTLMLNNVPTSNLEGKF